MADRGRGGNQPPRNPAAVSAPGSGRRTDGGAGSKSQPLRVPTGGAYGQAGALEAQQRGAPLASAGSQNAPAAGGGVPTGGAGPGGQPGGGGGVFGPSTQPGATPVTGTPRQAMVEDPQMFLRVLYGEFPHPAIAKLLRRTGSNG